jgi:hypothetical protein
MSKDNVSPSTAFARSLTLNVVAGVVVMYVITIAICLRGLEVGMAAAVSALPAVFAGPFLGGLVTMVRATSHAEG